MLAWYLQMEAGSCRSRPPRYRSKAQRQGFHQFRSSLVSSQSCRRSALTASSNRCQGAPTTNCIKQGHFGTCPRCAQLTSVRHSCVKCRQYGVRSEDIINMMPPKWDGPYGPELLSLANGKPLKGAMTSKSIKKERPRSKALERASKHHKK